MAKSQVVPNEELIKDAPIIEKLRPKIQDIFLRHRELEREAISNQPNVDVHTKYLLGKRMEIGRLQFDIDQFENSGGHFTKRYRILEGFGTKLITDLDAINVVGRDELRADRKSAYQDIDKLMIKLAEKAHPNGIVCDDCDEMK